MCIVEDVHDWRCAALKHDLRELNILLRPLKTKLIVSRRDLWVVDAVVPISEIGKYDSYAGILFVADKTDPYDALRDYAGINLLVFSDSEDWPERTNCKGLNMLVIGECCDKAAVCARIEEILAMETKTYDLYKVLIETIIQNTIRYKEETLYGTLSEIAGNPLVVLDSSFKPIVVPPQEDALSQERGGINYAELELALKTGKHGIFTDGFGRRFLTAPIKYLDIEYGYMLMYERHIALDCPDDTEFLHMLGSIPAIVMQKGDSSFFDVADNREVFLLRLISREFISQRYIDKMSLIFGLTGTLTCESNYIAVFRVDKGFQENTMAVRLLAKELMQLLNGDLFAIKSDHIILLFSGLPDRPFSQETGQMLNSFLKSKNILAGISKSFSGLTDLFIYYEQAINASLLFERINVKENYIAIQDYMFFDLLLALSGRKILQSFISRKITALMKYDEKHGTNYMVTLRYLLDNGCNTKQTAEKMFIHRNTLLYRQKLIEKISGLNFKDSEDLFNARMSLKIIDFLSKPVRKDDSAQQPSGLRKAGAGRVR